MLPFTCPECWQDILLVVNTASEEKFQRRSCPCCGACIDLELFDPDEEQPGFDAVSCEDA